MKCFCNRIGLTWLIAAALIWPAVARAAVELPPVAVTNIFVVDPGKRFQVMDNFGANDAWSMQKIGAWSATGKNRIADLLFATNSGIGLTCWRFNLGAGINHQTIRNDWRTVESFEVAPGKYDWNRQANERWFLRAAKARGVRQFAATVYSPPLRLTRNGLSNLGADAVSTTNLKPGAETEFARYLTDILTHFRDQADPAERIDFDYVLPVNEPQWDWTAAQEGNRAANADLQRIFRALQRKLAAAGLRTKILGPESGSIPDMYELDDSARKKWHADYGDYLRLICGDPQLATGFGGVISYHSYWSDRIPDQLVPHRTALGRAAAAYPGWKLWQSEYCIMEYGRDLTMASALRVARVIHCDLTLANAAAWQWWEAVANEDFKSGLIYTDYQRPGDAESIYESKILWTLGNYSRFIRPGMQRIELHGTPPPDMEKGVLGSAYRQPETGRLVLVFINLSRRPQALQLVGTGAKFATFTTSATDNLRPGTPVDLAQGWTLPARSVVTFVETVGEK